MLNRFGVNSEALSLKMHIVLPNWLYFGGYFYSDFFIILLEHGAFSSMQSISNILFLVSHSKFTVHLLHTTCSIYIYIYIYISICIKTTHNVNDL